MFYSSFCFYDFWYVPIDGIFYLPETYNNAYISNSIINNIYHIILGGFLNPPNTQKRKSRGP
jgi:hypothetical protein